MSSLPIISVLMPAYNAEKYIRKSIESILVQTFEDFELIIVDDGSTDNTVGQVMAYKDPRIQLYRNDKNEGLIYTRNRQISLSKGEYIAFLDSDDIAEKTRLEKEYNVISVNQRVGFVSSSFIAIDENGNELPSEWKFDLSAQQLKATFLFLNPIATSSVLLRKNALPEMIFRDGYPVCEDYDLWTRIIQNWDGIVLPDVLTRYRVYNESICKQQPENIIRIRNRIVLNQLEMYFPKEYSEEDATCHLSLTDFSVLTKINDLKRIKTWIKKLICLNKKYHHFDELILKQLLYERLLKKFLRLEEYNFSVYQVLMELKKELQPALTWELKKKEIAILAFSVANKKFIQI